MPPYHGGAPFSRYALWLFDYDFTIPSLGGISAAAFLAATAIRNPAGLVFERSTETTVQDSDSSIISGIAADYATIGNLGSTRSRRGLVIQPKTRNGFAGSDGSGNNANRDLTHGAWTAGSSATLGTTTGVDGTASASTVSVIADGYSPYANTGGNNTTVSFWGSSGQFIRATAVNVPGIATSSSPAYKRLSLSQAVADAVVVLCDGRNHSLVPGGSGSGGRSAIVDYAQYEFGLYVTEATTKANFNRGCDKLSYANGGGLVATNGQIKFYAKFVPKHASTNAVYWDVGTGGAGVSAGWFLWSFSGVGNYVRIRQSDRKLCVKIAGGTEVVSTNAIAWTDYDVVEVYVAVGNNVASVAKYRINGGAWVDLVLATIAAAPSPGASPLAIMHNIDTISGGTVAGNANDIGQTLCWLNRLTFYNQGAPSGV